MSTSNHNTARHISNSIPKILVSLQEVQPSGSVQNLNRITTKIGKEKDSISLTASKVYPFTGNSFNLFRTQPPCGASCFVTEKNGFANRHTRKIPGINKNRIYNSHTLPGGKVMRENGWTTTPACAAPF